MKIPTITLEQISEQLRYDAETGLFWWLTQTEKGCKRVMDKPVGTKIKIGYIQICFQRQVFYAHRLAFLFMTGQHPTIGVDHINGNRSDNRWVNLRLATQAQNMQNRAMNRNNTSGYPGVYRNRNLRTNIWSAQILSSNKIIELGSFATKEEAYAARCEAKARLHSFNPILTEGRATSLSQYPTSQ